MRTTKTLTQIVDEWIDLLDALPATKSDHRRKINLWLRWLAAQGIDPRTPGRADVLRYKQELQKQGKSVFTVNGYVTVIKVFYKHCATMRYYDDIGAGIKTYFRTKEHYKHPLTREQCNDLLSSINRSTIVGARDYLMIQLMLTNGLRTCEVQRINIGDFDMLDGKNVLHIQRKGRVDKHDVVAIPDEVMASLEDYLSMRTDDFNLESPLFINLMKGREHSRILKPTISGIVKQRLRSIGIDDPKITAHSLRHTCGSLMVEEGMSIDTIQDMLGHNDPATTQIYIDMARQKRLLEHSPSETIARIISQKSEKTASK
jgi:site-specific recombinase XerD